MKNNFAIEAEGRKIRSKKVLEDAVSTMQWIFYSLCRQRDREGEEVWDHSVFI